MSMPSVLVLGGAGYIGSHMVKALQRANYYPVILDNFSQGSRNAVQDVEAIEGDIGNYQLLEQLFCERKFSAVMHFASCIEVHESILQPAKYYTNNVAATITVLHAMLKYQIRNFIFSSSAAVYGNPLYVPIDEKHPLQPINPYGHTKRMIEQILEDYARAYQLHYAVLRYFNAAGLDPDSQLVENHQPETHLIPLVIRAAYSKIPFINIYGNDYATIDGTCIRDYVHVLDLCMAHLLALERLRNGANQIICNLGSGKGYSVKEVIDVVMQLTQKDIAIRYQQRRAGDPEVLLANPQKAQKELGWIAKNSDLKTIIQHALKRGNQ